MASSHATPAHAAGSPPSRYFVPDPSAWPFVLTAGLFMVVVGVWGYLEGKSFPVSIPPGPLPSSPS